MFLLEAQLRWNLEMQCLPGKICEHLLGKGLSRVFGSHWVTPISIEPLQELIFLSIRT